MTLSFKLLAATLLFWPALLWGADPFPVIKHCYYDSNGDPLVAGKLYTYAAGTVTPLTTYATQAGATNTNPVVLDSIGCASVFGGSSAYKFVLKSSADVTQWTVDNFRATASGGADDLGNHTATANIQLGSYYLSGDGGNEGIEVDSSGNVTFSDFAVLQVSGTSDPILQSIPTTGSTASKSITFKSASTATGSPGTTIITSGTRSGGGTSGATTIQTGGSTSSASGAITMFSGPVSSGSSNSGSVSVSSGTVVDGTSGNVTIGPGSESGSGANGKLRFTNVSEGTAGHILKSTDTSGSAAWSAPGVQTRVAATATTIVAAQCGFTFYNSGAVEIELPEADANLGCRLTFITMNAANFDVDPDAADQIFDLTNAAGDRLRNATIGQSVTIEAVVGGWASVAISGTWSDAN